MIDKWLDGKSVTVDTFFAGYRMSYTGILDIHPNGTVTIYDPNPCILCGNRAAGKPEMIVFDCLIEKLGPNYLEDAFGYYYMADRIDGRECGTMGNLPLWTGPAKAVVSCNAA